MRRSQSLLLLFALAAGCVPRPAPSPAPQPQPAPAPAPAPSPTPLAADWRDWPVTPGDWVYRRDERGSVALFGARGADAQVVLRCDLGRRTVFLSVAGADAAEVSRTVRTSSTARTLRFAPTGGTPPYLAVALTPNDPLLDAMGFSRGRFAIDGVGVSPLALPAWPEIERVVEDCRA